MKYKLNTAHKNKALLNAHVHFFMKNGIDPYGVFKEYTDQVHYDTHVYAVLELKGYSSPFGLFQKDMFIPAEPETKLEDWL